ncbi:MAG: NAD kinase [Holosporales bacterium]
MQMIQNFHFIANTSPKAVLNYHQFQNQYKIASCNAGDADVFVVFGGDGFMLKTMRDYRSFQKPFYGINSGHVGFLLNTYDFNIPCFKKYINECVLNVLNPLSFTVKTLNQEAFSDFAINEVALTRRGPLVSRFRVFVNEKERISCSGDGILLSTPAGSTAYNASAGGEILPLSANLLALTPLCVYKPRHWRGAILNDEMLIEFQVDDAQTRPMNLTYDHLMIENILSLTVKIDKKNPFHLLFSKDISLEERILKEQFV